MKLQVKLATSTETTENISLLEGMPAFKGSSGIIKYRMMQRMASDLGRYWAVPDFRDIASSQVIRRHFREFVASGVVKKVKGAINFFYLPKGRCYKL